MFISSVMTRRRQSRLKFQLECSYLFLCTLFERALPIN